jgi:hypothetical protein
MPKSRNESWTILRPYPKQLEALRTVADGCSLTEGARRMGIKSPALGALLSGAYSRLKIKDLGGHHLSQDRRRIAVNICKREGWWDTDA